MGGGWRPSVVDASVAGGKGSQAPVSLIPTYLCL